MQHLLPVHSTSIQTTQKHNTHPSCCRIPWSLSTAKKASSVTKPPAARSLSSQPRTIPRTRRRTSPSEVLTFREEGEEGRR